MNIEKAWSEIWDVAVIGSGIGGLTAACMLAHSGKRVFVLEQNYLPGGCVSSYYRKGFVFEAGATTLVGLDDHMPLKYLLDTTGVQIDALALETPMKVYLKNGTVITRYPSLDKWVEEAERVFGKKGQRPFWEYCYEVSHFVWQTSLQQLTFPPSRPSDLVPLLQNFQWKQVGFAATAFTSMQQLLRRFDLLGNALFVDFVNEQLLITAQNDIKEVNVLFGSTALCYTNFGNYYVKGGLINLVQPLCSYIHQQNGQVFTRVGVEKVHHQDHLYHLTTNKKGNGNIVKAKKIISSIPINNTLELFDSEHLNKKYRKKMMRSEQLVSAFGMGIGFKTTQKLDCIHHQIHLDKPLPYCNSKSIFLSLNHPTDTTRTPQGEYAVANISTHIHHPEQHYTFDKEAVEQAIFDALEQHGFLKKEDIVYHHSYLPASWEGWLDRKYGFVGGYPQYMKIKPWQMLDARLDGQGAYICGDTTYPGQGIPGTALSGLIAWKKLMRDGF
jgi:C-3',4' desaturase CrtD